VSYKVCVSHSAFSPTWESEINWAMGCDCTKRISYCILFSDKIVPAAKRGTLRSTEDYSPADDKQKATFNLSQHLLVSCRLVPGWS